MAPTCHHLCPQLGYSPLATINLDAAVSGACIPPVLGCADTAATNFHSAVNVHLALDCTYSSPPSPPPFPEAIVLRLTTSYTLAQLDTLALASTVDGFLAATDAANTAADGRRLQAGAEAAADPARNGANQTSTSNGTTLSRPSAADWVISASWRDEFPRRLAIVADVSAHLVDLTGASAVEGDANYVAVFGGGTELTFSLQARMPSTRPAGLLCWLPMSAVHVGCPCLQLAMLTSGHAS